MCRRVHDRSSGWGQGQRGRGFLGPSTRDLPDGTPSRSYLPPLTGGQRVSGQRFKKVFSREQGRTSPRAVHSPHSFGHPRPRADVRRVSWGVGWDYVEWTTDLLFCRELLRSSHPSGMPEGGEGLSRSSAPSADLRRWTYAHQRGKLLTGDIKPPKICFSDFYPIRAGRRIPVADSVFGPGTSRRNFQRALDRQPIW